MNQILPPISNNWSSFSQMTQNICIHPNDQQQVAILAQTQKALVRMERDSFKIFADKKRTKFSPECIAFFRLIPSIAQLRFCLDQTIEINSYIRVIFEELSHPMHEQFLTGFHTYLDTEYYLNTIDRIKSAVIQNKCALKSLKKIALIKDQVSKQKKNFSQLLIKHQELNCFLIELPFEQNSAALWGESLDSSEKNTILFLKKYLKNIHVATIFDQKLCDIQWRIIKNFNGKLTGQILIYLVNINVDCQPAFQEIWTNTTKEGLASYSPISLFYITPLTCYMGNGVALKEWKEKLDLLQIPLEFYSYKANGISFEWKSYTGNLYALKSKD